MQEKSGGLNHNITKLNEACQKKYAVCASTEDIVDLIEFEKKDEKDGKDGGASSFSVSGNQSNSSHVGLNFDFKDKLTDNCDYLIDKNMSFTVLDAYEYEDNKLIKFWNPRHEVMEDWKGQFSHDSEDWSLEIAEYVNYEDTPGIFYATFEEYMKFFAWTYFCKIEENFLYRTLRSRNYTFNKENVNDNFAENVVIRIKEEKNEIKCKLIFILK